MNFACKKDTSIFGILNCITKNSLPFAKLTDKESNRDFYGRRQKVKDDLLFVFTYKPHKDKKKCLLLFNANTNIFTLLTAEDRRQKFHFCHLLFDVASCLISRITVSINAIEIRPG